MPGRQRMPLRYSKNSRAKLEEFRGNLTSAAVELAKDWRTDRVLRRLEALLAVAGPDKSFLISGTGDVVEPEDGMLAIGSGGSYALAAARALLARSTLDAKSIVNEAMMIAGAIDIYTNQQITDRRIVTRRIIPS